MRILIYLAVFLGSPRMGWRFTTPSPLLLLGHDFLGSQNSEHNRLAASRVRWETIRILIVYRSINIAVSALAGRSSSPVQHSGDSPNLQHSEDPQDSILTNLLLTVRGA